MFTRWPRSLVLAALLLLGTPATPAAEPPAELPPSGDANIHLRGSLDNCRIEFDKQKKGHVAFIGGSITEMNGYRPMVCDILKRRFPDAEFTFTDAGIASTCSTTGAFRLEEDVLSKGPVDLFFVEFAVNDDQDAAHARRECIRGMEGIIRHCRRHNPNMDIVITHFCNPEMIETLKAGKTPLSSGSHDEVARRYDISTIDLAKEVAGQIVAGTLTWERFGGTHPAPFGNALCAGMIDKLLSRAWQKPLPPDARRTPHAMPTPLDENNYQQGRFIDPSAAKVKKGWIFQTPPWKQLPGSCRGRFQDLKLLCADAPGDQLTLDFSGRAIGAYVLAGPDAGVVEASIDGGPFRAVDLYHRFSKGLHYPRTVVFDADLSPGKHALTVRVGEGKNQESRGHAVRILEFVAN
jgi:lysophospholipase L1-like esterase